MYLTGSELKSDHCHKAKERLTTKIHDVILRIRHTQDHFYRALNFLNYYVNTVYKCSLVVFFLKKKTNKTKQ